MIEGVTPGCQCSDCVTRYVADLILYCMKLEKAAIQVKSLIDHGAAGEVSYGLIAQAAALAMERDLSGELRVEQETRNVRTAAELRAQNRLQ